MESKFVDGLVWETGCFYDTLSWVLSFKGRATGRIKKGKKYGRNLTETLLDY